MLECHDVFSARWKVVQNWTRVTPKPSRSRCLNLRQYRRDIPPDQTRFKSESDALSISCKVAKCRVTESRQTPIVRTVRSPIVSNGRLLPMVRARGRLNVLNQSGSNCMESPRFHWNHGLATIKYCARYDRLLLDGVPRPMNGGLSVVQEADDRRYWGSNNSNNQRWFIR
jgi:hypothetical protein